MIALKGRVRVKVIGVGKAGDRIVSAGNGVAQVAKLEDCTAFNVLGRLLSDKYDNIMSLTECAIGVK
jgi:cell division GTPase FtsZ